MPLPKRQVKSALRRKGFQQDETDHHIFTYAFEANGKRTEIMTKTSHGTSQKDIGDPLVTPMARQCHLNRREFEDLVKCPLSREAYERLLHERL